MLNQQLLDNGLIHLCECILNVTLRKPGHLDCHIFDCHMFVRWGSLLTLLTLRLPD